MPAQPSNRGWFWAALAVTAVKLWLVAGQRIYAIGPAFHDDQLFVTLAAHLVEGNWLGPYTQFTLAKGPMYSLFIAGAFLLGIPLLFAQQLFYAAASAAVTHSLRFWVRSAAARFLIYVVLLWNPMSFEANNLSRVLRQNVYTPLALLCLAGLITLFARRREAGPRQALPAATAGLAFGCFWLTREESIWFVPAVGLLLAAPVLALREELAARWRALAVGITTFVLAALLPLLVVCVQNYRHYGWFGTVEFRAKEFTGAYGALTRPRVGPTLDQVPVTRQMREAAYAVSPSFAKLRPQLEGAVGDHWIERNLFPASERQIRGGWFVWAIRDAAHEAGLTPDAASALRFYQAIADEMNAACDAGKFPSRRGRSGFLPPLTPDQTGPLLEEAGNFARFFFLFRQFTAYSPDSVGDYADLKPFRNIVGTRLSNAPRSPELPTPEQDRRNAWKVETLDSLGRRIANALAWIGPALLFLGLIRVVASALERRCSYALGLAAALLVSCCAYLAINVLVQVTSFQNMSTSAMATAYPLYLLALVGIVLDLRQRPRHRVERESENRPSDASAIPAFATRAFFVASGVALTIFGARLAEVHFFGSDIPYGDQWIVEAQQIIEPWLKGELGLGHFFQTHFDQMPVWTHVLTWLQLTLTGRWDPLVQMTINAALYATFAGLVAHTLWRSFRPLAATLLSLVLLLGGCLPHAWENITWGLQSQFPLALTATWLFLHGTLVNPAGGRRWWMVQLAGVFGLGTLASFWLAPVAVLATACWLGKPERRAWLASGILTLAGLLVTIAVRRHAGMPFLPGGHSALEFFDSALHLLGWPSALPGSVALLQLPWFVHAWRLRQRGETPAIDRLVFALGLLNLLRALALAFGRIDESNDFISRNGDMLFLGVLAGAAALARLAPPQPARRPGFLALATGWTVLMVSGLAIVSSSGHARYFHRYAAENDTVRRTAIQNYLERRDRTTLDAQATQWVLSTSPDLVARLLDRADFRALLPSAVIPTNPPGRAGELARGLEQRWLWIFLLGALTTVTSGALLAWRKRRFEPAALPAYAPDPWRYRVIGGLGGVALVSTAMWANPFGFDSSARWRQWLGGDQALQGLSFKTHTASPFASERLQGAAPLRPEELRNQFFGTAPEGPAFTGTVLSSPFTITRSWMIVPYAGYPVGHGNGLRIRLLDESGNQQGEELGCPGPNREGIGYWPVDVRPFIGRKACLVLYDGRTDTEAWVAASAPIPSDAPDLAITLARGLESESHSSIRGSALAIAVAGLLGAWIYRRRDRSLPGR